MTHARPTLMLIDGHALAFRAFHALADAGLRSSTGEPTFAVFGFTSIMLNALAEHHPEYIAVAFDLGRTFRDEMYAEYKAGRGEAPPEFHQQLDRIKELLGAFNIPVFTAENYEADDIIGTLSRQATAKQINTLILTGDTDTLQLVDEHVRVVLANPFGQKMSTKIYDVEAVLDRYKGLRPDQLADLRGLKGDASDNIPGVKGIGEAGAIALLNQFGTVESIYEHFDEVPKRYQKPLDGQLEIAKFSKHLATIHCEVPVTLDLVAARVRDYDRSAVIALFQELEFGATMVKRLPASSSGLEVASVPAAPTADTTVNTHTVDLGGGNQQLAMFDLDTVAPAKPLPVAESVSNGAYRAVQTEDDLRELLDEMNAAPAFAFDTETSGLRPLQDELVGMSFSASSGRSWYVPVGHQTDEAQLPRDTVLQAVRPLFSDPAKRRYAHNAKFDVEVLEHAGVAVASIEFDTMLAAALLDKRRGLKELAFYELKLPEPMTALEDLIGRGKKQITFGEVPIEAATGYAAADADMTLRLVHALEPQIRAVPEIADVFYQIEMPLLPILVRMEQAGIGMDTEYMRGLGKRMGERLHDVEQQIYAIAKRSFNINSGDQLSDVLFNMLQLPTAGLSKTSTGRYSLTAEAIEGLREHDSSGILELILQFRQLSKLKSTYVDALPQMVNPETGRVHTTYSQLGAATGRLSCLPAGTLVNTQNGLVGIETVQPGDLIRTPFGPRRVLAWQATGEKSVVVLKLSNGITLRCSPEHRIRSKGAWVEAKDITVGAPVYMSFVKGLFGSRTKLNLHYTSHYDTRKTPTLPVEWTVGLAELVGYHMADGHIARSNYNGKPAKVVLAFGWDDHDLIEHFRGIIRELFNKEPVKRITKACPILEVSGVDIGGALEQIGAGGKSHDIRVPRGLFNAPEPIVAAFLRGYFEGDGYAGRDGGIMVRSVSRPMLEGVQQLLTMFGIPAIIRNGSPDPRGYAPRYTLAILGDRSKLVFYEQIGFLSQKKQRACQSLLSTSTKSAAEQLTLPASFDINTLKPAIYAAHHGSDGRTQSPVYLFTSKLACGRRTITLPRAEWVVDTLPDSIANQSAIFLHEAVSAQYYEVRVAAIMHEAPVPMYDIAVDHVAQYMAQGIVVHNSNDPNLQNIPTRTDEGREVRRGFVAAPGHCFVAADYSQIELRVLAHITQDENLVRTFLENEDIHAATAARLFGVPMSKVSKNQRRVAKTVVFGVIYGISAFGLAQRTELSRSEAQQLIDGLFATYPALRDYFNQTLARGREWGYVQTLFGRRRPMADLKASGPRRAAAEREAINAPIQGTAADIMKMAMIQVDQQLRESGLKARMLLQVHDELIFEAPDEEVEQTAALVRRAMEHAYTLRVPLLVEVEKGSNWEEMQPID